MQNLPAQYLYSSLQWFVVPASVDDIADFSIVRSNQFGSRNQQHCATISTVIFGANRDCGLQLCVLQKGPEEREFNKISNHPTFFIKPGNLLFGTRK
jgi:hypothetical protein